MRILIVGSGGREHTLGWKLAQSPHWPRLYFAPGNAGTEQLGENLPLQVDDALGLVHFAKMQPVDLVIIGPEVPLAQGLADRLSIEGIRVFGPLQAAAQIEASKVFAREFMTRHAIPGPRYAVFSDYDKARDFLRQVDYPVVIKASGLAAGKGVMLPQSLPEAETVLESMLLHGEFGEAGKWIVVEERLEGEEVSVLAFTDGWTVKPMPPAQDHKRLLDHDLGPNTGGMGAYAPAPICPPALVQQVVETILQPTIDGLRIEGARFVGVLYAGLMLTREGPKVLEFNCRFGDPETQVILPLLDTDLVDIVSACIDERLDRQPVAWKPGSAACVVLASANYPGKVEIGLLVSGLENSKENSMVFHAGTRLQDNQVLTAGGRVLGITGIGSDLQSALNTAYQVVEQIHFPGMQCRKDIGFRALGAKGPKPAYARSGVDIDAGNRAVELISQAVRSTYGQQVLMGIGAFGGLYDAVELQHMHSPVLVASTDGVGTKVKLAAQVGRYESIGQDIVNHCINDILVQGARPLFFLDYFATSRLEPGIVAKVVDGIALACRQAGCALLGGETAEMPGVYQPGEFDVAGTILGVVEKANILPRQDVVPGDVLIGLRSSGPHTNGYSLIRSAFAKTGLDTIFPELGVPLAEALLAPHRSYLNIIYPLLPNPLYGIKALSHLTGGGFFDNIPRVLPDGLGAHVYSDRWETPALFRLIQQKGNIGGEEMYRVFNMGIGLVVIVASACADALQAAVPEETYRIGEIVAGDKKVTLF
jgi:phosphoribosylamine--glycine ligase/phosphoribosylformylglycinamidine cyclo-ligase